MGYARRYIGTRSVEIGLFYSPFPKHYVMTLGLRQSPTVLMARQQSFNGELYKTLVIATVP